MTWLPRFPQISVALLAALGPGCVTVVPMQTASVVAPGAYRLSGSATLSTWCSVSLDPAHNCNAGFAGGVPLPEARVGARHGLQGGFDLGSSLQAEVSVGRGYQLGLYADAKKEVWERETPAGHRQLLSVAPGLGYTAYEITSGSSGSGVGVLDAALPVYFGHQSGNLEWVAGAKYIERFIFTDVDGDGRRELLPLGELAVSVGLFAGGATKFGVELAYQSGVDRPWGGLFNISAGVLWDVGLADAPAPAEE